MPLRDHLRADENGPIRPPEALERLAQRAGPRCGIRVEADALELGNVPLELLLEALRAGSDVRELDRATGRAGLRDRLTMPAVMAVEPPVAVEREGDVAVPASPRQPTGAAVDRRCHAAPVEQQDRLSAPLGESAELGQERRRERIAALPAQVDDADARHRRSDPGGENDPLERRPALGPRCGAAVDGNRPLESRALRGDGSRVVARIGLLLVRGVVLLVDDHEPEVAHRGEDRRACADDDPRLATRDPDRARRGARPDRAPSGGSPPCRRSARGSARRSAVRARSRARGRSCRAPARAPPRTPAGTPPSSRSPSARRAEDGRRPSSSSPDDTRSTAAPCSSVSAAGLGSPGSDSRSAGDGRSPRGARRTGATSSRARAGVVP